MGNAFLLLLIGVFVGFHFGWRGARVSVAVESRREAELLRLLECERLGGFFVGQTVYQEALVFPRGRGGFRCTEVKALDERGFQAGGTPALPGDAPPRGRDG